ncbi:hypothetical protein ABY45_06610 [Microbacterium maritypicum]|uniref:hypothetical protein n=1 Tax=Microbacterium maritypicum TaxID=33918 RepID=UPI003D6DB1C8
MSAKDLAARAAAVGSRRQRPDTKDESPTPPPVKVRTDPVRLSTDLSPNAYRDLIAYCADLAVQAGKARVPHTLVLRKLIDELQSDPALRERIAALVLAEIRN